MKLMQILRAWLKKVGASENVVHYLCGSEALPLPLSNEEETETLRNSPRERTRRR